LKRKNRQQVQAHPAVLVREVGREGFEPKGVWRLLVLAFDYGSTTISSGVDA
jgi:hypothetical protein